MYFLGIDVGSIATKAVLLSENSTIIASDVVKTGARIKKAITIVNDSVLKEGRISRDDVSFIVATGYGRKKVGSAQRTITEITAQAHGALYYFPKTRVIIDIGGQDTKVTELTEHGEINDFVMNDKCAAGTGRFLEVMAHILDIPLETFGERALTSTKNLKINSTCTVFAESEVVSLISQEERIEDIASAIHSSVVDRIISLVKKIKIKDEITVSGGVSNNIAICEIIKRRLHRNINIPPNPQIVGAVGAALLAKKYSPSEKTFIMNSVK